MNYSIPSDPDIMVDKLVFYTGTTAHIFFPQNLDLFVIDKSAFQKFIRKPSIPFSSVLSSLLQKHQTTHKHKRKTS